MERCKNNRILYYVYTQVYFQLGLVNLWEPGISLRKKPLEILGRPTRNPDQKAKMKENQFVVAHFNSFFKT